MAVVDTYSNPRTCALLVTVPLLSAWQYILSVANRFQSQEEREQERLSILILYWICQVCCVCLINIVILVVVIAIIIFLSFALVDTALLDSIWLRTDQVTLFYFTYLFYFILLYFISPHSQASWRTPKNSNQALWMIMASTLLGTRCAHTLHSIDCTSIQLSFWYYLR